MTDRDPTGRDAHSAGAKLDAAKRDLTLVPMRPLLEAVAAVQEFGAQKYTRDGWREVPEAPRRYFAAMMRHLIAYADGEDYDPDSGMHHLDHAACNMAFLLWFKAQGRDVGAWRYGAKPPECGEMNTRYGFKCERIPGHDGFHMFRTAEWPGTCGKLTGHGACALQRGHEVPCAALWVFPSRVLEDSEW